MEKGEPENLSTRLRANKRRWLIALVLPLAGIATAANPLPDRASYFAGGFAAVFGGFSEFMALAGVCRSQFTESCGRRMQEIAPALGSVVETAPLITVFDAAVIDKENTTLTEASLRKRVVAAHDKIGRELLSFDKDLLQRYRALISVCPYRSYDFMPPNLDVTFPRYWQLSPSAYAAVKQEIEDAANRSAQQIRGWPKARCYEARNFGATILSSLELRLRPYGEAGWENLPAQEFNKSLNHVFNVALTFEETVHPNVRKAVEAKWAEYDRKMR
ncbi:hypothetical protein ACFPN2_26570 [Steroidobacter flavus]|uniref:Uncharacterized protein n=1 Tax=Steroidobacter flavus TaxID=1842136 RepID=A0ABV8T012_9GAMM